MKRFLITFSMLLFTAQIFAQGQEAGLTQSMHNSGKITVVLVCAGVILFGLLFFLFSIEKRLKKLERKSAAKN
jgi:EamA domain-containing membrane protein RarD